VGGGGEKYVPPDPPTHLILERTALSFSLLLMFILNLESAFVETNV